MQYPLCCKIKTDGNLFSSFASAVRRSADWRGTEGISLLPEVHGADLQLVEDEGAVMSVMYSQDLVLSISPSLGLLLVSVMNICFFPLLKCEDLLLSIVIYCSY